MGVAHAYLLELLAYSGRIVARVFVFQPGLERDMIQVQLVEERVQILFDLRVLVHENVQPATAVVDGLPKLQDTGSRHRVLTWES